MADFVQRGSQLLRDRVPNPPPRPHLFFKANWTITFRCGRTKWTTIERPLLFPPRGTLFVFCFFIFRRPTASRGHREPVGSCSSVREVRFHVVAESNFAWRIPAFLPIPGNGRLWGLASPAFLLCRVRGQCVEDPFLEREAMIGVDSLFGFLLRPGLLLRYWCVSLEEPFQARDDTALRRKRRRGHVRDPSLSKQ